jgi:hypothetical protein
METLDVLKAARALLGEGPHRWTQDAYARNSKGESWSTSGPDAARFCVAGACLRFLPEDADAQTVLCSLREQLPVTYRRFAVSFWNDRPERTYEEVLALFDKAIEAAS